MNENLFIMLNYFIPKSFVSVINDTTFSSYSFYININEQNILVEMVCYYSYTDNKNLYSKYEIYVNETLCAESIQPIFQTNQNKTPNKLEILFKKCSKRVIEQENNKIGTIKTLINENNQHIH